MEMRRFLNAIYRKLWLIILLGILGGSGSFCINYYNMVPLYEASTTILTVTDNAGTPNRSNGGISYDDIMIGREFQQDFRDIMMSEKVLLNAADKLKGIPVSAKEISGMISLGSDKNSNIVKIRAYSDIPQKAIIVSKAVSAAFIERLNEITKTNIIGVLDEAKEPLAPMENDVTKGTFMGLFAGVIIAFVIVYITELFDSVVRSADDIEYNVKLPVLAQIPIYVFK